MAELGPDPDPDRVTLLSGPVSNLGEIHEKRQPVQKHNKKPVTCK